MSELFFTVNLASTYAPPPRLLRPPRSPVHHHLIPFRISTSGELPLIGTSHKKSNKRTPDDDDDDDGTPDDGTPNDGTPNDGTPDDDDLIRYPCEEEGFELDLLLLLFLPYLR